MIRIFALFGLVAMLTACGETQLNEPPEELGEFKPRVTYVYTEKALQWPLSRSASHEEWTAPIQNALDGRLQRHQGSQEYDVAVTLEGFMLAPPGVPVLLNPKSAVVVNVFVYDVAAKEYLAKKHQMEIFESTTGQSAILGSGHARTKDEQIAGLSINIADKVEEWMAEQHLEQGWFNPRPASEPEQEQAPSETAPSVPIEG